MMIIEGCVYQMFSVARPLNFLQLIMIDNG